MNVIGGEGGRFADEATRCQMPSLVCKLHKAGMLKGNRVLARLDSTLTLPPTLYRLLRHCPLPECASKWRTPPSVPIYWRHSLLSLQLPSMKIGIRNQS